MSDIKEVLHEMRSAPKNIWRDPSRWADAIEAAMREKDAEIERLNSENTLLRTGDTCARHCEGVAFRHEAQRLKADNQRLENLVSGMKGIANTQKEIIAEQNEKIKERDGAIEMILLRELRLETALRHISLASQSSMSSKDECGRIAHAALAGKEDKTC